MTPEAEITETRTPRLWLLVLALLATIASSSQMPSSTDETLQTKTVLAFDVYIREAEAAMEETLHGGGSFLWSDGSLDRVRRLQRGEILAHLWSGNQPVDVPRGLLHDWIRAASVPGATVDRTLALIQDYDNHGNIYKPDVIDSTGISFLASKTAP